MDTHDTIDALNDLREGTCNVIIRGRAPGSKNLLINNMKLEDFKITNIATPNATNEEIILVLRRIE